MFSLGVVCLGLSFRLRETFHHLRDRLAVLTFTAFYCAQSSSQFLSISFATTYHHSPAKSSSSFTLHVLSHPCLSLFILDDNFPWFYFLLSRFICTRFLVHFLSTKDISKVAVVSLVLSGFQSSSSLVTSEVFSAIGRWWQKMLLFVATAFHFASWPSLPLYELFLIADICRTRNTPAEECSKKAAEEGRKEEKRSC